LHTYDPAEEQQPLLDWAEQVGACLEASTAAGSSACLSLLERQYMLRCTCRECNADTPLLPLLLLLLLLLLFSCSVPRSATLWLSGQQSWTHRSLQHSAAAAAAMPHSRASGRWCCSVSDDTAADQPKLQCCNNAAAAGAGSDYTPALEVLSHDTDADADADAGMHALCLPQPSGFTVDMVYSDATAAATAANVL
jgi:hypothetical protein